MLRLRPFEEWRLALLLASFFAAALSSSLLGACLFGLAANLSPASIILLWRAFEGRARCARLVLEDDVLLATIGGALDSACTLSVLPISFVEWRSTPASKEKLRRLCGFVLICSLFETDGVPFLRWKLLDFAGKDVVDLLREDESSMPHLYVLQDSSIHVDR